MEYDDIPRDEELNYNVYELLEVEEGIDDIEHLLPHELCGENEECVHSFYYGMFDNHDELVTYSTWVEGFYSSLEW